MSEQFRQAWVKLVGVEGGYADVKNDRGGKTKFGVTEKLAREYGYLGTMKDLDEATALKIAKKEFWDPLKLDDLSLISMPIAYEVFDSAYNMGKHRVAPWLQRILNALNRQGNDYDDIKVDGIYGDKTMIALNKLLFVRGKDGETVVLRLLNCLQGEFYLDLAESRITDEDFLFGWVLKRVGE